MLPLFSFSANLCRKGSTRFFPPFFMRWKNVAPTVTLFLSTSVSSAGPSLSLFGVFFSHSNALVLPSTTVNGVRGKRISRSHRLCEEKPTLLASPTSSLSICSKCFSCEGGLRRSRHLLAAAGASGKQSHSTLLSRSVSFQPTVSKKQTSNASTGKALRHSRSSRKKEDTGNGEEEKKRGYGGGKVRRNKDSAVGHSSFLGSGGASSSTVASSPMRQYGSPAQMTPQELEERDIRAAVRHVLSQYFMHASIEKRKQQFDEKEKKHDEAERLALLERELKRQEEILRRQELEKSRKSSSCASSSNGEKTSGTTNESGFDSSLLQSSPSALIQMYANTILSAGSKLGTSSDGAKEAASNGGAPMWSMEELQRLHHHIRMKRRQEEKERRAEELSHSVGTDAVGGVLPVVVPSIFGASSSSAESSPSTISRSDTDAGAPLGWRRSIPNPTGKSATISDITAMRAEEAARESLQQQDAMTALSLQPDLSLYSVEKDIRLSSEHVVRTQRLEKERYYRHLTSPSSSLMETFTEEWGNERNRPAPPSIDSSRESAVKERESKEMKTSSSSPLQPRSGGNVPPQVPHHDRITALSGGTHTRIVPLTRRKGEKNEWNGGLPRGNLNDRKTVKMERPKRSSSGVVRGVMKKKPMTMGDDSEEL